MTYNLGNLWRRLVLPKRIDNWSLTSLQATVGEDGRQAGQACPALLANAGVRQQFNPGSKRHLEACEREEHALELRKKGWSYKDIGVELGISRIGAYQCVMRVLAAYESDSKENIPAVRRLELERCDIRTKALADCVKAGDVKAIMADLAVSSLAAMFRRKARASTQPPFEPCGMPPIFYG
jgi:hypothetical protein